jgi:hypothetical protein
MIDDGMYAPKSICRFFRPNEGTFGTTIGGIVTTPVIIFCTESFKDLD